MIAADTNIVVRLLTGDDPEQAARARRLFETETVFLPKTVMLETEWVLRRLYRKDAGAIIDALLGLASLPNTRCEDETAILQALAWNRQGLDFADALHLASSRIATGFTTFDRALIQRAPSKAAAPCEPS